MRNCKDHQRRLGLPPILIGLLLLATSLALVGPKVNGEVAPNTCYAQGWRVPDYITSGDEGQMWRAINEYRSDNGLQPVSIRNELIWSSNFNSRDMARTHIVSHTDSLGRNPFQRMADCGWDKNAYKGENVAGFFTTWQDTLQGLKNSPSHNAILLGEHYQYVGIAQIKDQYGYQFWTLNFSS